MSKKDKSSCPQCSNPDFEYFDLFETTGFLVDQHLDTDITEDELTRRLLDATENAKQMGYGAGLNLEDDIGELLRPSLRWQDFVQQLSQQKRKQSGRPNWNSFRTRPLFAGLYIPKREEHHLRILIGLDTSASVSKDQATYGISQCQVIDHRGEAVFVCWDTEVKWKEAIHLKKIDSGSLQVLQTYGGGGTSPLPLFEQYLEEIGKVDLIVLITDGIFDWTALKKVKLEQGTDLVWILTVNNRGLDPPIGRVFNVMNER